MTDAHLLELNAAETDPVSSLMSEKHFLDSDIISMSDTFCYRFSFSVTVCSNAQQQIYI